MAIPIIYQLSSLQNTECKISDLDFVMNKHIALYSVNVYGGLIKRYVELIAWAS